MSKMLTRPGAMKRAIALLALCMVVAACGGAPAAPQTIIQTQVVEKIFSNHADGCAKDCKAQ